MSPDPLSQSIVIQVLFLIANFFFTMTETAVETMDDAPLKKRAEAGDKRMVLLYRLLERPTGYLCALQLERLMICGSLAALFSITFFDPMRTALTGWLPAGLTWWLTFALLALLCSAAMVIPGILIPRHVTLRHPEGALEISLKVTLPIGRVLMPLVGLLRGVTTLLLKLFGVDVRRVYKYVSEEEIMQMVDIGEEKGAIESDEREMIENIFEFNNLDAEDCMVHRKDIVALSLEDTSEEVLATIRESGRTRYPVYEDDMDSVLGVLNTRDYLLNQASEHPKPMKALLRPAYFVPESMRADRLFAEMQKRKQHMAIVVDEYGGTSGLVTLEDLLEEIVGDIYDEFDKQAEVEITPLGDGSFRVAGGAELETVAEALGVTLALEEDDEEIDTLSGLIFSHLPEIPSDGEQLRLTVCGLDISVESVRDRRVEWAVVRPVAETPEPERAEPA
ncbi:MAG: hemolysin family protein [Clostridia bacterium]|nr:hemolysin family protein [Clostridia bacterium]